MKNPINKQTGFYIEQAKCCGKNYNNVCYKAYLNKY